ncbi:hypothetical protein FHS18_000369 [Paenibacillus phyllosphaerae]|uniref:TIR domain-containing protein n=1 Tax=Paenibacillus phyllosphaerae TaxID=274593 RepID=A0A7W5FKP5_9BACL|nr:hypothetical protein [Paenibacillus phyllosphaerae]
MDKRYTAFISYSWDGPSHEQWIRDLVNDLRLWCSPKHMPRKRMASKVELVLKRCCRYLL